jgi:hypothetical protein
MSGSTVMAVSLEKRSKEAAKVQEILTKHGCIINARLGLHESVGESCSDEGLILLHLKAGNTDIQALENDLTALKGIRVKKMAIKASIPKAIKRFLFEEEYEYSGYLRQSQPGRQHRLFRSVRAGYFKEQRFQRKVYHTCRKNYRAMQRLLELF